MSDWQINELGVHYLELSPWCAYTYASEGRWFWAAYRVDRAHQGFEPTLGEAQLAAEEAISVHWDDPSSILDLEILNDCD